MSAGALAILVGGGPAPGINAVIAAATIEARNRSSRKHEIRKHEKLYVPMNNLSYKVFFELSCFGDFVMRRRSD